MAEVSSLILAIVSLGWFLLIVGALIVVFAKRKRLLPFVERAIREGWVQSIKTPVVEVVMQRLGAATIEEAGEDLMTAGDQVIELEHAVEERETVPLKESAKPSVPALAFSGTDFLRDKDAIREAFVQMRQQQRESTEQLIRGAAMWGWSMRDEAYDTFPEPIIEWHGQRPSIVGHRGGTYNALEAALRRTRQQEPAAAQDTLEALIEEMKQGRKESP